MTTLSVANTRPWHVLSDATDAQVRRVFGEAMARHSPRGRVALLAVGGYGRRELAPFSDLDLLLVHEDRSINPDFAGALWYPLWDSGRKVGHAVRTPRETIALVRNDLETATSLMTARTVAGDSRLGGQIIDRALRVVRRKSRQWTEQLRAGLAERHRTYGELAYLLEPDLKNSQGGLRDIQTVAWMLSSGLEIKQQDHRVLDECNDELLTVRDALHVVSGRPGDVLHLQDQAPVAELVGYASDDALMSALARVGRRVMWISDEVWSDVNRRKHRRRSQVCAPGIGIVDGEVHVDEELDFTADQTIILRVATISAREELRISRDSLDRLGRFARSFPAPWPTGACDELVAFLLEGERSIPVWEALEQRDLLSKIFPEWGPVRCKPQRNAFHRYTVDRHLWQTVANAASLVSRVDRPDLLVIAALFHDLGKGYPGDHTEVGVRLFSQIGPRMGLNTHDVGTVRTLIEHHLLLPDVATRRDISEKATIDFVAGRVHDLSTLWLLHALTEADALATGPTAWSPWKRDLVDTLVDRVSMVLTGGVVDTALWRLFPDARTLKEMAVRERNIWADGCELTVVNPDLSGVFATIAGVLSARGLDVLSAEAHSDEQGMAASRFRLRDEPKDGWGDVLTSLHRGLDGKLDPSRLLSERAVTYSRRRQESARGPEPVSVHFDDEASSNATMIEIQAPDRIGALYAIAHTMAQAELDIRHARITTLGDNVVDTFYVRKRNGELFTNNAHREALRSTLLRVLS